MLTGWVPRFKVDRELDDYERSCHLSYHTSQKFSPDDAIGVVRFNSTFIEFVDRTFKLKGMLVTAVSVASLLLVLGMFFLVIAEDLVDGDVGPLIVSVLVLGPIAVGGTALIWAAYLGKDLFQYTHYPVRFNRRTGKIHFFRHNGTGGVVTLRWGDPGVYFHIGRGEQSRRLRDLRCHVLDRDRKVQQTFTVGHFWDHENRVREEWELIRRYMEEGPENCFDHPADRMVALSTRVTWRNCWMMVCLMAGTNLHPFRWNLLFPLYGGLTLSRWLTMKSCRAPVFPPEIEAECAIAPGDPYRLPEPSYMAEFADSLETEERSIERHRQRQQWR
ncbi:hypothetical protein LY625_06405 [Lysobacter sp. GX 14042]|uniref:DUF6708 domain-containing protein n=1 Tax=Lysobacter sp. GX 14042 TaxID=2907155 RepID=UPI001F2F12A5|nr:DUF6708 domain-containing protein [Lysobacter sp. GX 14042]MCE7032252.1 hypothetical protein [Lysobacter sp. GX 14042]